MFLLIILDKVERHIVTLVCAAATLILVFGLAMHSMPAVLNTLSFHEMSSPAFWYTAGRSAESTRGINWSTIFFLTGMMIMVEGMSRAGFFRWMCMSLAKAVRYRAVPIFITFMILSAVLSMFIDSITVILFLAAVTVELAHLLRFDPIPVILSEIFCANLGGSATMCGDPPNIIIGTSLDYSFLDFLTNTGLIAGISLVVIVIYFYFCFRKELGRDEAYRQTLAGTCPNPWEAITNRGAFLRSCVIFLTAVLLLITHEQTGLTIPFIGTFIALLTLLSAGKEAGKLLKGIDYKTLLFFLGLFVVVGGLEETKILEYIADFIGSVSGGNAILMVLIIMWVSAIASAFVDNIPFAATMIPVILSLSRTTGVELSTLAWSLSMGTDIGGSATPIGASANVVGTSVSAKAGHPIGWGPYCRTAAPATVIVLMISSVCIVLRYF
ncbi:MAG: citrate transporter [Ruminiclostridium sp.]|nr:citrate transporter [Ruminiclostridium sp.]